MFKALLDGEDLDRGTPPPDLSSKQITFLPGVIMDNPPLGLRQISCKYSIWNTEQFLPKIFPLKARALVSVSRSQVEQWSEGRELLPPLCQVSYKLYLGCCCWTNWPKVLLSTNHCHVRSPAKRPDDRDEFPNCWAQGVKLRRLVDCGKGCIWKSLRLVGCCKGRGLGDQALVDEDQCCHWREQCAGQP